MKAERGARQSASPTEERQTILVGEKSLGIGDILALASGRAQAALDDSPAVRSRIAASQGAVEDQLSRQETIYGVNTGVGASVENQIPEDLLEALPLNLLRFHGCGTGRILTEQEAAATVAVRLASLARGYSGVRECLLEQLCNLLNRRLLPQIPAEGSVGASGDLTPLSYLAATLVGEREVTLRGEPMDAAEALAAVGLEPLELAPKESLALMNGTSFTTGLGVLAYERARRLARLAAALSAVASDVMRGNPEHFDERISALKPHPGQIQAARWMREDLAYDPPSSRPEPARVQDRYSLRCAPQILEIEINSVNDNPLIDPETGQAIHGGNFYAGHVCFAMDGLKTAVANAADLLDRQLVLLCSPDTNGGLPANLVATSGRVGVVHHGFKAMQISASALAAEALKLTLPASVFSRSTESHNQDKVSMGSIAARDCLRVVELSESVAAIATLALVQAVDLRDGEAAALRSRALRDAVRKVAPPNRADRRQDRDIQSVLALHRSEKLPIGSPETG